MMHSDAQEKFQENSSNSYNEQDIPFCVDKFYCPSGVCLPWKSTCNIKEDCPSNADEPIVCKATLIGNETCPLNDLNCESDNMPHCKTKTSADCNFEKDGFCQWQQADSNYDEFDWKRNQGNTRSSLTGPERDHTTGTEKGWYIYIEASEPRVKGDRAVIEAGPFEPNKSFCFTFYYHMTGSDLGEVNVYKSWWNRTNVQLMWTNNISIPKWKKAYIDVNSTRAFYLMVEGVCGPGSIGDIAIDDLLLVDKHCSKERNDKSPFCSFEKNCSWDIISPKDSIDELEDVENIFLQSNYLRLISSGRLEITLNEEKTARFHCMSFWFKLWKAASFTTSQQLHGNTHVLDHSRNDNLDHWVFAEMPLISAYTKSKLVFNVTGLSKKQHWYLAIDEIKLSIETCISYLQGGTAWITRFSRVYKSLIRRGDYGRITAFYDPGLSSRKTSNSTKSSPVPGFILSIQINKQNIIMEDFEQTTYSNLSIGSQVLVKESNNSAMWKGNAVYCPPKWIPYQKSCYYPTSRNRTIKNAKNNCQKLDGATLVRLSDKDKRDAVTRDLKSNDFLGPHTAENHQIIKTALFCEYQLEGIRYDSGMLAESGILPTLQDQA
ncbi:MAM and LDL-receptor class A domain-containing protein 1-like [Xenia sp. Carnegie-2017]|uniref:MAM and LDL-receptor class A domain-containing protein 1-like n=1 Tax=Xenia sp. Carnegie-2017 TaxID=2897299 RepID=UPI001F03DCA1|nr:MAM and LDL-receptor class A domain-containing protein 1-like [Xenia sp. Carnegie-2017]